jgi:predicted PurR-regulated permease PerM
VEDAVPPAQDPARSRGPETVSNPRLGTSHRATASTSGDPEGPPPGSTDRPWHALPQPPRTLPPPTPRVTLLIGAAVGIAVLLYMGREALTPFIVGLFLVYLLDPLVERLVRLRIPRWVAVLITFAVVAIVVLEGLSLTLRPLVEQVSAFIADLPALAARLDQQLRQLSEFYRGLELPPALREAIDGWLADLGEGGFSFDPSVLLPVVNITAGFLTALVAYLIIPVWVFYVLKDRPQLTAAFDRSLPPTWRPDVRELVRIVERVFGQWVRGQLILGITVGVATFGGLLLLGAVVDPVFGRFAVLLAIAAGFLELLPIIGPIIAAIPAILLAATAGLDAVVAALVLYTLIQQLENNILVPKIQGDAVQLHPGVVMFALVIGGAIAGLLGAILAIPIAAASRDALRYLFRRLTPPEESPDAAGPTAASRDRTLRPGSEAVPARTAG